MTSPLTVVQLVASTRADHGGPSRSVPALCTSLSELEASVHLLTAAPIDRGRQTKALVPDRPVQTTVADERGWLAQRFRLPIALFRELHRTLARTQGRPTVLHDHGAWLPSNVAAAIFARWHAVPLVISTRGMLTQWAIRHEARKKQIAWYLYQQWVLRQAALLHVTSDSEADDLRRLGLAQPIAVIPNGVSVPDPLPQSSASALDTRAHHRALFLSRIHPKKGLPQLLKAWAAVQPQHWVLDIVGPEEGRHGRVLRQQVRDLGLANTVHFHGPVTDEEKWPLYAAADLFVLPSHSENFGIVVAEALAAGVPVLTTTGTPWKGLETHGCGWWVDPTVPALTYALRDAVHRPMEERKAMGARGRTYVQAAYAWSGVARRMLQAYRWLTGEGTRPGFVRVD